MNASVPFVMMPTHLLGSDPYTQVIYTAIKSHFPKCFPSIQRISQLAGCSHVTVIRRIKLLAQVGLIKVIKGKRGQANRYEFPDKDLTHAEREAKKQGSWRNVSWKKLFFGSKKAVNQRKPELPKAVNQVSTNKNKNEQEFGYLKFKEAIANHPELARWVKPTV